MISAVSIYSVNEEEDDRTEEELKEDGTPRGVKKINEVGVFACTAFFSVFAYVWLYYCLFDGFITPVEAWLTLFFFFLMIGIAYLLDLLGAHQKKKLQAKQPKETGPKKKEEAPETDFTPLEFYNALIPLESGLGKAGTEEESKKVEAMKGFLMHHFKTEHVQKINYDDLKQKINVPLISRLKYRLGEHNKKQVAKFEVYRFEGTHTKLLAEEH